MPTIFAGCMHPSTKRITFPKAYFFIAQVPDYVISYSCRPLRRFEGWSKLCTSNNFSLFFFFLNQGVLASHFDDYVLTTKLFETFISEIGISEYEVSQACTLQKTYVHSVNTLALHRSIGLSSKLVWPEYIGVVLFLLADQLNIIALIKCLMLTFGLS